jgi:hypothetical protein
MVGAAAVVGRGAANVVGVVFMANLLHFSVIEEAACGRIEIR